ncbi:PASTA domain-containing protein [Longimicrobium sp.]|uniref:PASTA domain-containing protein n=1 Tax=Longimicrobium sp. TaxID=2029185 RepID=UPI002E32701C|nr:PASTA domain-containing protein [Longimicrobium sp.]HEX6041794.1 PASTA domain-containing protein [Longimicrobium sp.]
MKPPARPRVKPARRFPAPGPGWHRGLGGRVRRYFDERVLLKWVLLTGFTCFVLGYLLITVFFFPGWGRAAIVTVPDLTNRSAGQAERALDRAGLDMQRGGTMPNPRVRQGRVLMQSPLPGEEVARGSTVRIVLSAGPEVRQVPSIRGLPEPDATALLLRYGFRVARRRIPDRRESGTILGLSPAAGQRAGVGSVVTMTLSAGPPFVRAPNVVGLQLADARLRLEAGGLAVGRVGYDPASLEPAGTIVAQSPAAGDSLRMGNGVRVTLAGEDPDPPAPAADSLAVDSVAVDSAVAEPAPAEPVAEPAPAAATPPGRE